MISNDDRAEMHRRFADAHRHLFREIAVREFPL